MLVLSSHIHLCAQVCFQLQSAYRKSLHQYLQVHEGLSISFKTVNLNTKNYQNRLQFWSLV